MHFYASPFKCTAPPCALDYRRTAPFQCAVIQACCFFNIRVRGEFLSFSLIPSCIRSLPASSCLMQSRPERIVPSAPALLSVHSDSGAVERQCKHKHDPEINVFNLDEGGDQRGPHSLAGQLSIDQELQMHSLDSDTEL